MLWDWLLIHPLKKPPAEHIKETKETILGLYRDWNYFVLVLNDLQLVIGQKTVFKLHGFQHVAVLLLRLPEVLRHNGVPLQTNSTQQLPFWRL